MINEITCNSNNAIELSRGQLLNWLNTLLRSNITKIQQLGTGAIYCQLLDIIYPGKVPLSKVNWKAKLDYQYLNNFKILQQSFTKLNIMRHIDVEKLVKCKYQDNLQFLQWFKKIFDNSSITAKDYDPLQRRGEKENKTPMSSSVTDPSENTSVIRQQEESSTIQFTQRRSTKTNRVHQETNPSHDEGLLALMKAQEGNEKEFYLRKLTQIEHLMEKWNPERKSAELIENIRNIILVPAEVNWSVETGQFKSN